MARALSTSIRRMRWLHWFGRIWAFLGVVGFVVCMVAFIASGGPNLWPVAAIVWAVSIIFVVAAIRGAVLRRVTTRVLWWAALRDDLVSAAPALIPPLGSAPERVVGRTEGPSRGTWLFHALVALVLLSSLLTLIAVVGIEDRSGAFGERLAVALLAGVPALGWGVWNAALALAPRAEQPVVLEADADELWIQLREGDGWMPTARDAVRTRAWSWDTVRSATLRGPRDGPRLRYLGLYLTDPRGFEYTYDLTDVNVSIGDLEAMLTERAGIAVQVEVAPE